ncbi:hypothetical protein GCM10011351_29120 [Paraliobacillus quinghaiensis]|uniref:Uncharacterized protein n=1 Tax=Paraliobacillus quinghaiensis TaxID=470815 RepID=A0A917WYN3_9BACI|nr:hypothetical protein GCM10011351_29120 [Paraliobacillus quinghaiensis]
MFKEYWIKLLVSAASPDQKEINGSLYEGTSNRKSEYTILNKQQGITKRQG